MCDYGHTPECSHYKSKSGCTWCKASEDKSGNAVVAFKKRDKRIELCVERLSRRCVLSTIYSQEDRMATNKATIQSAKLSHCGKTLPYKRNRRTFTGVKNSGDERMIAIRTPHLMSICINKEPALRRRITNSSKETAQTCLQNPRDVPRKKGHVIQNKDCYKSHLRTGIT